MQGVALQSDTAALPNVGLSTILIAVGAVVALAIGAYLLRSRVLSSSDQSDSSRDSTQERVEHQEFRRDDTSLGFTKRFVGMTTPAKYAVAALTFIFLVVGWAVYDYLKTGSPTQILFAHETQLALGACVACGLGIALERRRRRGEGVIHFVIEGDPEDGIDPKTRSVYFSPGDEVVDSKGRVVTQRSNSRFLGWFRNPVKVADDRELRRDSDVARPLSDNVTYRLPKWAEEIDDHVYVARTQGLKTSKSPQSVEDYTAMPPFSISREERLRIQSNMQMIRKQKNEIESQLVRAQEETENLRRELKQHREDSRAEVFEVLERLGQYVGGRHIRNEIRREDREAFRSSRDEEQDRLDRIDEIVNGSGGESR